MKAILAAVLAVLFMVFLASVAIADELYPVRVYEQSPGPNTIRGSVVSVDREAGQFMVKPTNLPTLLPGAMTLSTDSMTKVKMCGSSKTFEDIKVGEKVEVQYQSKEYGKPIAEDINVRTKTC